MSKYVLFAGNAPFVLNSAKAGGLTVSRLECSWGPSSNGDASRQLHLSRYLGPATGTATLQPYGLDVEGASTSEAVQGGLSTTGALEPLQTWELKAYDEWSGASPYLSYGAFHVVDLSAAPVLVADGHALLVGSNTSDMLVNIYFEE